MIRTPRGGVIGLTGAIAALAIANPVDGQGRLRYRPVVGSAYHMHVWTTTTSVLTSQAGARSTWDYEGRESVTRRVVGSSSGSHHVVITRDSVQARIRRGGEWESLADVAMVHPPVTLVVDDRFRVTSLTGGPVVGSQLYRGLAGGTEVALPLDPVAPNDVWRTEMAFRLITNAVPNQSIDVQEARIDERLPATATISLDSVLVRGGDTLAFMTYEAAIVPVIRAVPTEVANSNVTINGTSRGRLIWSTAWDAYVSGTTETHIEMRVRVVVIGEDPTITLALDTDVVSRFQVRP